MVEALLLLVCIGASAVLYNNVKDIMDRIFS